MEPDKRKIIIIAVVIGIALLAVIVYLLYQNRELSKEETINEQLKELLKKPQPLPESEINKQLDDLNNNANALSEEEVKKQLEELNKGQ